HRHDVTQPKSGRRYRTYRAESRHCPKRRVAPRNLRERRHSLGASDSVVETLFWGAHAPSRATIGTFANRGVGSHGKLAFGKGFRRGRRKQHAGRVCSQKSWSERSIRLSLAPVRGKDAPHERGDRTDLFESKPIYLPIANRPDTTRFVM